MSQFTSDDCGLENARLMDDMRELWSDVVEAVRRRATRGAWDNLEARLAELGGRVDCFHFRRRHEEQEL